MENLEDLEDLDLEWLDIEEKNLYSSFKQHTICDASFNTLLFYIEDNNIIGTLNSTVPNFNYSIKDWEEKIEEFSFYQNKKFYFFKLGFFIFNFKMVNGDVIIPDNFFFDKIQPCFKSLDYFNDINSIYIFFKRTNTRFTNLPITRFTLKNKHEKH
jgi:hypothetical protein